MELVGRPRLLGVRTRTPWGTVTLLAAAAVCPAALVVILWWSGLGLHLFGHAGDANVPRMALAAVSIGTVRADDQIKSVLVPIVNPTSETVEISNVSAGCGCVSAAPTLGGRIGAHGIGFVEAQANVRRAKVGRNEADLVVTFANLGVAPIGCRVSYDYHPIVQVLGRSIVLASAYNRPLAAQPACIATAEIKLVDGSAGHGLRVISLRSSNPYIDLVPPARVRSSDALVIEARLRAGAPISDADDKIVITTNVPEAREVVVDAHVTVAGAIRLEPAKLLIREVLPGRDFAACATCTLAERPDGGPVRLLRYAVEPRGSDLWQIATAASAGTVRLTVRGRFDLGDWDQGAAVYKRRLLLSFDRPVVEEHVVDVIGIAAYQRRETEVPNDGQ